MNMVELKEKASSYAEENILEVLKEVFAKVYADGYYQGYKDREDEFPVDLCNSKTEYIDLGLPSGTLWASDYEKEDDNYLFLPYSRAAKFSIPTQEQWEELRDCCKWEYDFENRRLKEARCTGPNGNVLRFKCTGMINSEKYVSGSEDKSIFWIKNDEKADSKYAVKIFYQYIPYNSKKIRETYEVFSGYKLPLRFVKSK